MEVEAAMRGKDRGIRGMVRTQMQDIAQFPRNLTFCLMTCGEETEAECLAVMEPWKSLIKMQEVRNVTPASKALNKMFEQCETKFLVPLDADMILDDSSLGSCFYERIKNALHDNRNDDRWHTILFPLWDTLTETKIYAFKVFNMKAMRSIPYKDDPCPDIQHFKDMTAAGLRSIDYFHEEPIGKHVVRGKFFCYAKYRDLYLTARSRPRDLLESHFKGGKTLHEKAVNHRVYFSNKYDAEKELHYLYCIAGMLDGLTGQLTYKSKDLSQREMRFDPSIIESGMILTEFDRWAANDKKHRVFA